MRIPNDWTTERASGWGELHHLVHTPCGVRSRAVDVILNEREARQIIAQHICDPDN